MAMNAENEMKDLVAKKEKHEAKECSKSVAAWRSVQQVPLEVLP